MTIPMKLFDFFFMNLPGKSLWNLDAHADSGTRSPPPPQPLSHQGVGGRRRILRKIPVRSQS